MTEFSRCIDCGDTLSGYEKLCSNCAWLRDILTVPVEKEEGGVYVPGVYCGYCGAKHEVRPRECRECGVLFFTDEENNE